MAVAAVLQAGLRYEGFEPCGCGRDPKSRPRTSAQVRQRRRLAARRDIPLAEALEARDPYTSETAELITDTRAASGPAGTSTRVNPSSR
ncbi:hypothetical protein GCM10009828_068210 [Actinoplanes couchii]|uniref:Uncharacterized protein n=1 Tax=Actinoplanes couchii TaxID=403638 RepID=A0ABQ3XU51_9ACTN|nr:hypothetical protein Aco03nite_104240 [Actinoplanes couchii]